MDAALHEVKRKVCVVGGARVGKTSLIRRFVYDQFDDRYLFTIGASVSKTVVELTLPGDARRWQVSLILWDIMGEKTFGELLKEMYFRNSAGLIAVADLSRPETFPEVNDWIRGAREATHPDLPVVLLGNKLDLVDLRTLDWSPLAETCARFSAPFLPASAKAGDNVQAAFSTIAHLAVTRESATGRTAPVAA